jgi:hypothetical protein
MSNNELDSEIVRLFEETQTVRNWEGVLYGYMNTYDEGAVRRSLRPGPQGHSPDERYLSGIDRPCACEPGYYCGCAEESHRDPRFEPDEYMIARTNREAEEDEEEHLNA